jgi:hypothetical protein
MDLKTYVNSLSDEGRVAFKEKVMQARKDAYNKARGFEPVSALQSGIKDSMIGAAGRGLARRIPLLHFGLASAKKLLGQDKQKYFEPKGAEHIVSILGSIAADAAIPMGVLSKVGKVGKTLKNLSNIKKAAATGVGYGALYGALNEVKDKLDIAETPTPKGVLKDSLIGSALGGVTGGALGGVIQGGRKLIPLLKKIDKKVGLIKGKDVAEYVQEKFSSDVVKNINETAITKSKGIGSIHSFINKVEKLSRKINKNNKRIDKKSLNIRKLLDVANMKAKEKFLKQGKKIPKESTIFKVMQQIKQVPSLNKEVNKLSKSTDKMGTVRNTYLNKIKELLAKHKLEAKDVYAYGRRADTEGGLKGVYGNILKTKLNEVGIKDRALRVIAKSSERFDEIKNQEVLANDIYRRTGVDVGSGVQKAIRVRNKSTYQREPLEDVLNDIEIIKRTEGIKPEKLYKILETPIEKLDPKYHALKLKKQKLTDAAYEELKDLLPEEHIGYIKDHMPRFTKSDIYTTPAKDINKKLKNKDLIPGFIKERYKEVLSEMEEINLERDPSKALSKYTRWIERLRVKKEVGDEFEKNIMQLEARGYQKEASRMQKLYKELLYLPRDDVTFNKMRVDDTVEYSRKLMEKLGLKSSLSKKGWNSIMEGMYNNYIGLNLRLQVAQKFQLRLVGGRELGDRWISKASKFLKDKTTKKALEEIKFKLYPKQINFAETTGGSKLGKTGERIKKVSNIISSPFMKLFTWTEKVNRDKTFAVAYNKLKKLGLNKETIKTLDATQTKMVKDAYNIGGLETAAREYGVIMANRINFLYDAINKPEILKNKLGDFIPFTTWSRGMWSLYYNDFLKSKGVKDLAGSIAKRYLPPLILVKIASELTGIDFTKYNPSGGIAKVPELFPMVGTDRQGALSAGQTLKNISPLIHVLSSLDDPKGGISKALRIKYINNK